MIDRWEELFDAARHGNGAGNLAASDELVRQAIEASQNLSPDSREYSSALGSFALWYRARGSHAAAIEYEKRHIQLEKQLGIGERELGNTLLCLAEMQQAYGQLHAARDTIADALSLFPRDCLPEVSGAHQQLAVVMTELGDLTSAQRSLDTAKELKREWNAILASLVSK